ncbi:MAG: serine hydrolase, partial [Bacteroidales bacterium]|nr:serine hydrolase [Bacteroidales bacterium]
LSFLLLSTYSGFGQHKNLSGEKIDSLDIYFSKAVADWDVPGMAIAIVDNDSIIFSAGYGVTNIYQKQKVDANTMFAVASITKTFTATAIMMLEEEGALQIDDRVTDHLPYFELYDPFVTHQMKVRDLLCHRTGLATFSGDLLWYGTIYSTEEVIKRARYLQPKYGFREKFGYSNIMFMAAGEVIESVSGMKWSDYMQKHYFEPLGMQRTITSTDDITYYKNVADPHTTENEETIPIPWLNWDNMAPAGAIISSVNDVAQWIRLQLNQGVFQGDTIFSSNTSLEMWKPHTILEVTKGSARLFPSTQFKAYGLGWSVFNYHGAKIVGHNGGYDGMISQMILIPEKNIGFVILTNKNSSLYYPLMYKLLDEILVGKQTYDWSGLFLDFQERQKEHDASTAQDSADLLSSGKPSLPNDAFVGSYTCKMYGDVLIKEDESEGLVMEMVPAPLFTGTLTHKHLNTFIIKLDNFPSLPEGTIHFIINKEGKVREMEIDIPNPDFDFTELHLIKNK